ncbi:hypothetical protein FJM67_16195 [Maribrevibacterium harenarium]|uniref:Uncharacterized protein n=1 Tax=Maribrevibacterium harenarium TaxID=2589817 RepID=A0A501W951_9GAMM|nr:hypothetical protein [Maribrevibacterium harenarium]TPE46473.1 hypothetical protein FJM67_16195 [Maribrevibacterium harenarium]
MANFEARSAKQPDLDDIGNLVRFTGGYLLEEVKEQKNKYGWPIRIAKIADIENTGVLELRLLGDNFANLEEHCGDYINLEAAIKRYNGGYYYYLVWAEAVTDLPNDVCTEILEKVQNSERQALEQALRLRCETIVDPSVGGLCIELMTFFGPDFTTLTLRNLLNTATKRHANELCVEMAIAVTEVEDIDDMGFVGKLLANLSNQAPFEIWSKSLLGS